MDSTKNTLERLCNLLLAESTDIDKRHLYEEQINLDYKHTLKTWVNSYENYRKYFGDVLQCFERTERVSLTYSISIYLELFEQVVKLPVAGNFDTDIFDSEYDDGTVDLCNQLYKIVGEQNLVLRLSELEIDLSWLSHEDIKKIINLLIDYLHDDAEKGHWNYETVVQSFSSLAILHVLAREIDQLSIFYHGMNIFFDLVCRSEMGQQARDLGEELLITSFKDKVPFYGYFIMCRIYSAQTNIPAALLYGNLFLTAVADNQTIIHDKFQFEIFWQSLKIMRDGKLYPWVKPIYESIPTEKLNDQERQSIDLTYYSSLIGTKTPQLPSLLKEYLDINRERIIRRGEQACVRWLVLLHNIVRLPLLYNFEESGLRIYLKLFESIVPEEIYKREKDILEGNAEQIKYYLKEALLKLKATRRSEDYVFDNDKAVLMAHRLLCNSFELKDVEAFLLAMIILSDHSVLIEDQNSPDIFKLQTSDTDPSHFYKVYDDPRKLLESFNLDTTHVIISLLSSDDDLYQFSYSNSNYTFNKLLEWNTSAYLNWVKNTVPSLRFETTRKDRYGSVSSLVFEDYMDNEKAILEQVAFPRIKVDDNWQEIFLIKDINISALPHNLILDNSGKFVASSKPITNILSIEWLNSKRTNEVLSKPVSKLAWFPLDQEDRTIQMLHSKLQETFDNSGVKVIETTQIPYPLSSDINIIASHGASDISQTYHLFPNEETIVIPRPEYLIGSGKILILLVCHSGSTQPDFFRNKVASLAKHFLSGTYQAVIAPFWALHIDVPHIWLPKFLEALDLGETVSRAAHTANKSVFDHFATPAAWACMHVYGNPWCRFEQN